MRGLWLEDRTLRLAEDLPRPEAGPGEALIRVRAAGICNTDLELVRGYYPYSGIPGHEFVGRVEAAPGRSDWTGRRVVGEINVVCGRCNACQSGRGTHCERRSVLGIVDRNGVMAEYVTLPVENLHPVPDDLSDEVAVFAEPTAAALEVRKQVEVGPEQRVLVIGNGKLGQLVAQTLALTGCELLVIGRRQETLAPLKRRGIATALADSLPEQGADVVVECTGNAEGFAMARRAVRPRGTIVLKSTYRGQLEVDFSSIVVDEITLVGSRCGPFAPALELLARGAVDVAPLIHARYPLAEGVAAFEHAARPGVLKVLLEIAPPGS